MIRGTQLSVVLIALVGVALLALAGPAAATGQASDGNVTLGESDADRAQAGTVDIAIEPAEQETGPGAVTSYEVVVRGATNGIEGYDNIEITIEDPSVAQFVDFFETAKNNNGEQGLFSVSEIRDGNGNKASEGPVLFLEAGLADRDFAGADRIVIAEVDTKALGTAGDTSNVSISETVNGDKPAIQNRDEDVQTGETLVPSTVSVTNLSVDIVDTDTPVAGDDLQLDVAVQSLVNSSETQQLSVSTSPDIGGDSTQVTLPGNASTVETLSVPTSVGDAGDYTVTVASDNSEDTAEATVLEEPGFAVSVLDTSEPVEGDAIQIEFEVQNVDTVQDTQQISVSTSPDIGGDSTQVTLPGNASTVETLSVPTSVGDAGDYTVTVTSNQTTDSTGLSVLEQPLFDVEIVDVSKNLVEGGLLRVNYTVTNPGGVQETQDIGFAVNGSLESTETNVTVTANATVSRSFTYQTVEGDAPAVGVSVASEDDTATQTVPVDEPPFFAVSVTGVDSAVTEGETLTLDYEITNTGDTQGTQTISFAVNGTEEATESGVTLGAGGTFTGSFTDETTDGDAPAVALAVASKDDTAGETVTVNRPPLFEVTVTGLNSEVTAGETVTLDYQVTNTGDVEGTQEVTFTADGTIEDTEPGVTLGSGETFTGTFTYETGQGDVPEVTVAVASANTTASETVTVEEPPFFDVVIAFVEKELTAGDSLTVAYTVTNTGDVEGTQDITLAINGTTEGTVTDLTLTPGETESTQFTYGTNEADIPALAATVASANSSDTATVPVNEPAVFEVAITGLDSEVTEGETVTLGYQVTNTGGTEDTQDIGFTVNGTSEGTETDLTLGGGESANRTFSYTTGTGEAPAVELAVASEDDTASETVTVEEPPFLAVSITGVDATVTEGQTVTVDYEVTNTGDIEGTQDIGFVVDGTTESTEPGVTVGGGATFTGTFTYETGQGDTPGVTVAVTSSNETASQAVTVEEPPFFAVAITGLDSEVTRGETLTLSYEVTNTGDVEDSQTLEFRVDGTTEDTATGVTLGENETATGTFTYDTASGDPPGVTVSVASNNDTAAEDVTVNRPADFAVTIIGVDSEVPEGAEVSVDYQVENVGDATATQTISFAVNGTSEATEPGVSLDGGETFADTFVYATEQGDTPAVTVAVASENNTATANVTVSERAVFAVTIDNADETVTAGGTVTLDYEVTNTGDLEDTQDITVTVDGSVESVESGVTLTGGETFSRQFTYNTDRSDVPAVTVNVSSEDNAADRTVTVEEPPVFEVAITDTDGQVTAGETLGVGYQVTNTGDVEGTQEVTFSVNGSISAVESNVTLGPGATFNGTFTDDTTVADTPAVSVSVASNNSTATETVAVLEAGTGTLSGLDIAGQGTDATLTVGVDEDVAVTVTNTGDQTGAFDVTLQIGNTVNRTQTTTQLAGGEAVTLTFVNVTGSLAVGEYSVGVATDDDSRSGTLTVTDPAASALSGLDIASQGNSALIAGGDAGNISATVTNVGGQAGVFVVSLAVESADGATQVEQNTTVTVDPGESAQATLVNSTVALPSALPNYTVTLSTVDATVEGELAVYPDVTNDGRPATDRVGDETLDDIDGNGEFAIFDVQALFRNFEEPEVRNTPEAFDFNEDGEISIFDVQALFNTLAATD